MVGKADNGAAEGLAGGWVGGDAERGYLRGRGGGMTDGLDVGVGRPPGEVGEGEHAHGGGGRCGGGRWFRWRIASTGM